LLAFCLPFSVFSQAAEPSITIPLTLWMEIRQSAESLSGKVTLLETSLTTLEAKWKAQLEAEKTLQATLEAKLTDSYTYSTKLKKENSALRFWLPVLGTVAAGAIVYAILK
jgi:hypothetical protein